MSSTSNPAPDTLPISSGTWAVDPAASELGFKARGMWGIVPVKGTFGTYTGTLTVEPTGVNGELRVTSASLDTGNAKRDEHLRSADFFDAEKSPEFTFSVLGVAPKSDGTLDLTGVLEIRGTQLNVTVPASVETVADGQVKLSAELSVDRAAAGVGWSKMGMIQGKADLRAALTLNRS